MSLIVLCNKMSPVGKISITRWLKGELKYGPYGMSNLHFKKRKRNPMTTTDKVFQDVVKSWYTLGKWPAQMLQDNAHNNKSLSPAHCDTSPNNDLVITSHCR